MWKAMPDSRDSRWLWRLSNFCTPHLSIPSVLDKVISSCRPLFNCSSSPFWLSGQIGYHAGADKLAWFLLIRAVVFYRTSPLVALISAKVSLTTMSQYYERYQAGMKPSAKASVLGLTYMLMTMLGDHEEAKSILEDCLLQFNTAFNGDRRMAVLPIITFLDILIVLRPHLPFEDNFLKSWKKAAYMGDMGFFSDLVAFLKKLQDYTEFHSPKLLKKACDLAKSGDIRTVHTKE